MPISRILTCEIEPVGEVNAGRVLRVMTDLGCWQLRATRL